MPNAADADGYFKLTRRLQARCHRTTWNRELETKSPIVVEGLDTLLSGLDRMASCFGGCRGGDHGAEYLTGRAVSACTSAMLLMERGYYDEPLSTIRNLGELALAIDEERYRFLSSYSIHASPNDIPQAHNDRATASIAPTFEAAGFLLCLNELVRPMAFIGLFACQLCSVPPAAKEAIHGVSRVVVEHIGGVTAEVKGRPWLKLH